jgi:hypothetical protein
MNQLTEASYRRRGGRSQATRWVWLAVSTILGAVALTGCMANQPPATPRAITGDLTLTDATGNTADPWLRFIFDTQCETQADWAAIVGDAAVTLSDPAGKRLAEGKLKPGVKVDATSCRFVFALADVPAADTYRVRISSAHDFGTFEAAKLEAAGWQIHLTLKR